MSALICRLCSGPLELVVPMRPMPLVDRFTREPAEAALHPADVYLCKDCRHAQMAYVVDPKLLFSEYLFRTADDPALVEHYRLYAADCWSRFRPRVVVEIGSNDGTLLDFFEKSGCRCIGVDPSDVAREDPRCIPTFFDERAVATIQHDFGAADLVCANHVFAHADDLMGMIRNVKNILAGDGVFVFEAAYLWDMLRNGYYDTIYHEHLSYHHIEPLVRAFARCNLELWAVQRNGCKGGSIRGFVSHPKAGRGIFINREPPLSGRNFELLNDTIRDARERVADIPCAIGYGASASGAVTMYQLCLESRLAYLVDDNPRRWGLYSPGANLRVRRPAEIYDSDLPIVILATRYTEAIKARHPKLKGRFIACT